MVTNKIDLKTADGVCDCFVAYPSEGPPHPGVLFYMDAFGLRAYLDEMVTTLASKGYYVLAPNLLYRARRSPVLDIQYPLKEENKMAAYEKLRALPRPTTEMALRDASAFVRFLSEQKQVRPGKIGVTGYCMGGTMAIRTAGLAPDRVAAVASFHSGNLATDAEDSPHRLLPKIKGELYVAHADNDQSMPPDQIQRFAQALEESGIDGEAEVYKGAAHGFTMLDLPAGNKAALDKHWQKLSELFARNL